MKKILLSVVAVAAAVLILLDFFFDSPVLDQASAILTEGAIVLAAFAMLLGLFNLLSVHATRVRKREKGWGYSAVLAVVLVVMVLLGIASPSNPAVTWAFRYVYSPLQATIFSLLAFFVASAAYRAFRIRSWESALFALAGLIVLIGQVPISRYLWDQLPVIKDWVLAVPATAGARGLLLGAAIGTVIAGLRLLLCMDRPYL